jgi:hypothetical protein
MKKHLAKFVRAGKRHGLDVVAAGIGLLILATLEMRAGWAAFTLAPHGADTWMTPWGEYPRAALQHTATSVLFGLMAFTLWRIAADLRDDERPRIRARASTARIAALLCLCVPIGYLAQAGGLERQLKAREAYIASEAYKLDLRAADRVNDYGEPAPGSGDARDRLKTAEAPSQGFPEGADWAFAIFAHILVMVCAGVKTAAPINHHERKAMQMEAQAKIEAVKREDRNRRARERRAEKRREKAGGDVLPFRFGQNR